MFHPVLKFQVSKVLKKHQKEVHVYQNRYHFWKKMFKFLKLLNDMGKHIQLALKTGEKKIDKIFCFR